MKVIIADDHKFVAEHYESILGRLTNEIPDIQVIAVVNNGKQLLQKLNSVRPDVIFLDIDMPVIDGFQAASSIRERYKNTIKIIFISTYYTYITQKYIRENNIDGFISKEAGSETLREAFTLIAKGEKVFIRPAQQIARENEHGGDALMIHKLTKTEIEILKYISEGLSCKEIAYIRGRAEVTIETQRKNIIPKVGAKNMDQVLVFAAKHGLI